MAAERVARVWDEAVLVHGVRGEDLNDADLEHAEDVVRSLAARLGSRRR